MWKYIVTWCIVNVVQDPCPDINKPDEFGRVSVGYSCAVFHAHIEEDCGHAKVFYNSDSAKIFYNKAMEEDVSNVFMGGLSTIKLDSIYMSAE